MSDMREIFELGVEHQRAGRLVEAAAAFRRILEREPQNADALHLLGLTLAQGGETAAAIEKLRQAIAVRPEIAAFHNNLGYVLLQVGQPGDALVSFDRALTLMPDYAQALNNRGNALHRLKRFDAALASYDRAIAVEPHRIEARGNRANTLIALGRGAEALAACDEILAVLPNLPEALNSRGVALLALGRLEDARAAFDHALAVQPEHVLATYNRAVVLQELRRPEDAAKAFARLLDLQPGYAYARGMLQHVRLQCCDWSGYADARARIVADVRAGRCADDPFSFLAISTSPADQLQCARTYVADKCPADLRPLWNGEIYRHERIRVAYVSADFRNHPVAHLLAGLIEAHDRARFEILGVSLSNGREDAMTERLRRAFDRFVDVSSCGDQDVARLLREYEVDIAVDLQGYTTGNRATIFAHRAAPIQVNYLGYSGTTGSPHIDYILADPVLISPQEEACYSEHVVSLPESFQANDSRRRIADGKPTREAEGLPESAFVFCCFNKAYKIAPDVFDVWMRLLSRIENGVLWLFDDNSAARDGLRHQAKMRGVAPERLVFARWATTAEDHLARHALADLFLDTLPYNAHTTASDALWAGLPVLTCKGGTFAGRVSASLLTAAGLPEMITATLQDYERLAFELAGDPARLAEVRDKLAKNRLTHSLFDTDRFRRHIESAYSTMWSRWQSGEPPRPFSVPALP